MKTINQKIRSIIKGMIVASGTNSENLDEKLNDIDFAKDFNLSKNDNLNIFALSLLGQGWSL